MTIGNAGFYVNLTDFAQGGECGRRFEGAGMKLYGPEPQDDRATYRFSYNPGEFSSGDDEKAHFLGNELREIEGQVYLLFDRHKDGMIRLPGGEYNYDYLDLTTYRERYPEDFRVIEDRHAVLINESIFEQTDGYFSIRFFTGTKNLPLDFCPLLCRTKSLLIENIDQEAGSNITHLAGIEAFSRLVRFGVVQLNNKKPDVYLVNLNGIEFCGNLRNLFLPWQSLHDLTHLANLPIKNFIISDNPCSCLEFDTSQLENLVISDDQIGMLASHDLTSLRYLTIEFGRRGETNRSDDTRRVHGRIDFNTATEYFMQDPGVKEFLDAHPGCLMRAKHWDGGDVLTDWLFGIYWR